MHLVAANLKNGRHFEFWDFFRWLTGFIKREISKEYVCQFWCLFPEMRYFCVFSGGHFDGRHLNFGIFSGG